MSVANLRSLLEKAHPHDKFMAGYLLWVLNEGGEQERPDLTVQELCALLKRSRYTVCQKLRAGEFPGAYKDGRPWRIPWKSYEAWLAKKRAAGVYPPTPKPSPEPAFPPRRKPNAA